MIKDKIDFIICGSQKSGTTALYYYLKQHPQICVPEQKELHYFDNENNFSNAFKNNYEEYHSKFVASEQSIIFGEATPIYMYWYDSPRRIWEYNSDIKLIVSLRDPIKRAYSHWNMEYKRGKEFLSFSEAIKLERERCRAALPLQHRVFSYVDRGLYSHQLQRLLHFFPREQILFIKYEDFLINQTKTLYEIIDFLGIDKFDVVQELKANVSEYDVGISGEEKAYLKDVFLQDVKVVEGLIDKDLSDWLV